MDYAALFAAGVAGLGIGAMIPHFLLRNAIKLQKVQIALHRDTISLLDAALSNLRRNCFLTNERGHRVRYADASVAVRARAGGSN